VYQQLAQLPISSAAKAGPAVKLLQQLAQLLMKLL